LIGRERKSRRERIVFVIGFLSKAFRTWDSDDSSPLAREQT
jgi:hypothetical protein